MSRFEAFPNLANKEVSDEKLKQEAKTQVNKVESQDLTPEQVAGDLTAEKTRPIEAELSPVQVVQNEVISYFSDRLARDQEAMKNPDIAIQGTDFDIARCQTYIKRAREGRFLESADISGTYEGKPMEEKSLTIFDFFKDALERYETMQKYFRNDPDQVNEYKKKAAQAKKVVEAIKDIIKI